MSQRKRYNSTTHINNNNNNNNGRRHHPIKFHQPQICVVALLILFSLSIINGTFGAENSTVDDNKQQQPYKYSMKLMENGNVKNGFRPIQKLTIESSSNINNNNNNNNNNSDNNNNTNNNSINYKNDSENIIIKNSQNEKYHQTTTNEINKLNLNKKINSNKDNFSFFKNGAFAIFQNYDDDDDEDDKDDANNVDKDQFGINNSILENIRQQNKSNVENNQHPFTPNVKEIQNLVLKYVDDTLNRKSYEIISGFNIELYNSSKMMNGRGENGDTTTKRELPFFNQRSFNNGHPLTFQDKLLKRLKDFAETHVVNVNIPRAVESTGRLFFFKGLKKIMWPILIGVQIAKTILLALFLPSIIGSLGKIVGKGISSVSGYNHGQDTVQDFEFKDNAINSDQDKYNDYAYPQAESTNNNIFAAQMYDAATANNALSRFGAMDAINGQKMTYINQQPSSMMSSSTMNMKKDDFNTFHDIPASSMLLTNYDPFYSPLLSRLDAVYQQLGLGNMDNEICREKLVCLMYASPAKYAPYSNLVSAQLSRELNELRKPTSDNPDILRFFKYMRAAKDGQDGISCEQNYRDCMTLSESDGPAMINTYNDINKLVQARKIT